MDLPQKDDKATMDVYILKYDVDGDGSMTSEIIGVFGSFDKASKAFAFYLDEIEKAWRDDDKEVNGTNTFNRFSEPLENILLNAVCQRENQGHFIAVTRHPLE